MASLGGIRPGRPLARRVAVVICVLIAGGLFAGVARQSLATNRAAEQIVALEADGAAIMHPMTTLLSELVSAQSAAVRGEAIDQTAVRTAVADLFEPNVTFGGRLQTTQRLTDLRDAVEAAFSAAETGRAAYDTWSAIVDLAIALIQVIGDTSHLVHDPDLDSYYLMSAAIVRLPHAMVYAGRAADLVELAGGGELEGEDLVRAAVARFNVSYDAEQVSIGLNASVDATSRSELGTNIAQRLDEFRAAADEFAPPTMLRDLAAEVDAATMADNASLVFARAASLSHLLLSELQELLVLRAEQVARERRATLISSVAATVVGLGLLWLVLVPRRGDRTSGAGTAGDPAAGHRARGRGQSALTAQPSDGRGEDLAGAGARRGGHAQ